MKKSLLIAVLILAVITSLTAGTLAKYTMDLGPLSLDVTAKAFNFTGSGDVVGGGLFKIAPGETKQYTITLTQTSDVDMTYKVTPTTSGSSALLARLTPNATITYKIGTAPAVDVKAALLSNGYFTFDTVADDSTIVITYGTRWDHNDLTDTSLASAAAAVSFAIHGEQKI